MTGQACNAYSIDHNPRLQLHGQNGGTEQHDLAPVQRPVKEKNLSAASSRLLIIDTDANLIIRPEFGGGNLCGTLAKDVKTKHFCLHIRIQNNSSRKNVYRHTLDVFTATKSQH